MANFQMKMCLKDRLWFTKDGLLFICIRFNDCAVWKHILWYFCQLCRPSSTRNWFHIQWKMCTAKQTVIADIAVSWHTTWACQITLIIQGVFLLQLGSNHTRENWQKLIVFSIGNSKVLIIGNIAIVDNVLTSCINTKNNPSTHREPSLIKYWIFKIF